MVWTVWWTNADGIDVDRDVSQNVWVAQWR